MTERRPHWDDELIEAVGTAIENADSACYPTVGMVSDVIAAVEDWELGFHAQTEGVTHSAECWRWHHECARTLIEQQQAAIQRVRDVCDEEEASGRHWNGLILVKVDRIRRALDGDRDESE